MEAPIKLIEHQELSSEDIAYVVANDIKFRETTYEGTPHHLGVCPHKLCASYYIGAQWLNEDRALVVTPKMDKIDYIEMFSTALDCDLSIDYFSKFYGVSLDEPPIRTSAFQSVITPLIVIHYLSVVKRILKKGLKRDYVIIEENLQSKIKGKIRVTSNIKLNTILKRNDRVYCQYQDYTTDIPENRILKRALIFTKEIVQLFPNHSQVLLKEINSQLSHLANISDVVEISELKKVKTNKIFRDYNEGIRLAKMILRRYNYSLSETHNKQEAIPPFWIDMSRLYEVYVYSKLLVYGKENIKFQVTGYQKSAVDFIKIDEQLIIDTKYKPRYKDGNRNIIDDIRQMSAYARDNKIIKYFEGGSNMMYPCLIIYPEKVLHSEDADVIENCNEVSGFNKEEELLQIASPIKPFAEFYKLSIPLPIRN